MTEKLDNYFTGALSDKEKSSLFDKIESDEKYKYEFIRIQNTLTLSKLYTQKGDAEWANLMMNELGDKIKNNQRRQMRWNIFKYVAVITLLVMNGWLLMSKSEKGTAYTTIDVPKGQRVCMTLIDGTEVWLSPRSVLRIPDKFNKKERLVKLDGEGFFTVTKDPKRPFIVETQQYNIKVLGTRFNTFAYSESSRFETDLLEGRVEISDRNKPEEVVSLKPNEKISLENNQLMKSISRFNNEEYLKNGIFSFNNKPFGEILEYLSLWYGIDFEIKDSAKKELLISGKFRQSGEVNNILKALQGVHTFGYKEINEQKIEVF